ncbi:uncharacterized protein LTR77_009264 [Saxophila tyrrhenica]|uniref:Uncharacterized protein n=1 Tax=Saxophila tyrrhenica TaxID=1690608 RepID=A0AAV9NZJ4_9PEZI|nr:hypothetical protein LTR77_009264 [Saxophila tyrrhenica]
MDPYQTTIVDTAPPASLDESHYKFHHAQGEEQPLTVTAALRNTRKLTPSLTIMGGFGVMSLPHSMQNPPMSKKPLRPTTSLLDNGAHRNHRKVDRAVDPTLTDFAEGADLPVPPADQGNGGLGYDTSTDTGLANHDFDFDIDQFNEFFRPQAQQWIHDANSHVASGDLHEAQHEFTSNNFPGHQSVQDPSQMTYRGIMTAEQLHSMQMQSPYSVTIPTGLQQNYGSQPSSGGIYVAHQFGQHVHHVYQPYGAYGGEPDWMARPNSGSVQTDPLSGRDFQHTRQQYEFGGQPSLAWSHNSAYNISQATPDDNFQATPGAQSSLSDLNFGQSYHPQGTANMGTKGHGHGHGHGQRGAPVGFGAYGQIPKRHDSTKDPYAKAKSVNSLAPPSPTNASVSGTALAKAAVTDLLRPNRTIATLPAGNFQINRTSLADAKALVLRRAPFTITDDDVNDVEADPTPYVRELMRAVMHTGDFKTEPETICLKKDQALAVDWTETQSKFNRKVRTILKMPFITAEVQARAEMIVHAAITLHRDGHRLLSVKVEKALKCSQRLGRTIQILTDFPTIRYDVLSDAEHFEPLISAPSGFVNRKESNWRGNFRKPGKGQKKEEDDDDDEVEGGIADADSLVPQLEKARYTRRFTVEERGAMRVLLKGGELPPTPTPTQEIAPAGPKKSKKSKKRPANATFEPSTQVKRARRSKRIASREPAEEQNGVESGDDTESVADANGEVGAGMYREATEVESEEYVTEFGKQRRLRAAKKAGRPKPHPVPRK